MDKDTKKQKLVMIKSCGLDLKEAERLATFGAKDEDIGRFFKLSPADWLIKKKDYPEIEEAIYRGMALCRIKILELQMRRAEDGDSSMLKWLGIQHCSQSSNAAEKTNDSAFQRDRESAKSAIRKDRSLVLALHQDRR